MTFSTVFDVGHEGYTAWWFPAIGLLFVAVGALSVFKPTLGQWLFPTGWQGAARERFNRFFLLFSLAWTAITFASTYDEYRMLSLALKDGRYAVAEGPVTDFRPGPANHGGEESFKVQGRTFSYSNGVMIGGFHTTAPHGGPIHEGLYVRITYSGNEILRLEVGE